MNRADRLQVGDALRQVLGAPARYLQDPPRRNATIQVGVSGRSGIVGTLDAVRDEDGEHWVFTAIIEREDLAPER